LSENTGRPRGLPSRDRLETPFGAPPPWRCPDLETESNRPLFLSPGSGSLCRPEGDSRAHGLLLNRGRGAPELLGHLTRWGSRLRECLQSFQFTGAPGCAVVRWTSCHYSYSLSPNAGQAVGMIHRWPVERAPNFHSSNHPSTICPNSRADMLERSPAAPSSGSGSAPSGSGVRCRGQAVLCRG
jgi:hypothetical protein